MPDQEQKKTPLKIDPKTANKTVTKEPSKMISTSPFLTLPVIPIREGVLFPHTESVLSFGRKLSLNAIKDATLKNSPVVLLTQKNPQINTPSASDLFTIGTLAFIERTLKTEDSVSALVRGISRVKVINLLSLSPVIVAVTQKIEEPKEKTDEIKALAGHLQKIFRKVVQMGKSVEFLNFMKLMSGASEGELTDQVASTLNLTTIEKQKILEILDVKKRLQVVIEKLTHEMRILEIEKDVLHKTQAKFDKSMKESILRERLRTIKKELGEVEDEDDVTAEYFAKLKKLKIDKDKKQKIKKEIKRLEQMSFNNPESGYVRTWIDTIFELPFGKIDQTEIDLKNASKILNKNHYALKEVKERILEHIAVLALKKKQSKDNKIQMPTILCFVGPPGVGKTSIGRAIAEALKRKFTKISLGGVRDEAEIRGHRKTYVGAMPGKIIKGIIQAGSMNPVFILDEIDKLGHDFRGDPSAALLEVLDPEQNSSFEDHYIDMDFDLSQVFFITTANTLASIPPALKDRLEVINFSGYTFQEKFEIAKRHLLDKVLAANGLDNSKVNIKDDALDNVIKRYTREAGVRDLERNLHKIFRKAAKEILDNIEKKKKTQMMTIASKNLKKFLGAEIFDVSLTEKKDQVGVATGLAWTSVGGDILFIEVALSKGKGNYKLTGKLGQTMKESAETALTYVKANAKKLKLDIEKINQTDVHIHIPEGAVPKDGPSAGITMASAIVSAFTKKKIKKDIAMTGEITLRGRVLRIGGLKEKVLAAHLAGTKFVLIPKENKRDLDEIPDYVKKGLVFKTVNHMDDVLKHIFV